MYTIIACSPSGCKPQSGEYHLIKGETQMSRFVLFLSLCFIILTGCDPKTIGEKFSGGFIDFSSGVESGAKKAQNANSMAAAEIKDCRAQEAFTKAGLRFSTFDASSGTTKAYVMSTNAVKGVLILKAFDASDNEIGRGKEKINFEKDDAHLVSFKLEGNLANLKYYAIDFIAD